ncbi:MAG: CBO0543 family protein [bacterium]|jgi:hypothetical protein
MKIGANPETYIYLSATIIHACAAFLLIRNDWRRYGLLFISATLAGNTLCLIFLQSGLYSFPYRLFPGLSRMPLLAVTTMFGTYVLTGVRYSPRDWRHKIPFYWGIVHLGMLAETLAQNFTQLIRYDRHWDFWDSYTWWWIFLLGMEWFASSIIPENLRKPIPSETFRYGKPGWFIFHFIVIVTIFLGGFYLAASVVK